MIILRSDLAAILQFAAHKKNTTVHLGSSVLDAFVSQVSLIAGAVEKLSAQGISLSDALRYTLAYIAETGRPPVKRTLITDEDAQLIETVRERLKNPAQTHRMTFAELKSRHRE